jgi:hypothetical protein
MSKKNNPEYQHAVHLTKEEMRNIIYALNVTVGERSGVIPASETEKLKDLSEFMSESIKKWEM